MAGNTVNSIGTNTRKELIPSESQYIPQLAVFITEYLAINFLNLIAVIEFVKQRQLQRRSTHLVIHLAIIDLLAGAVSGPLDILWVGSVCDLWEYTQKIHLPSVVLRAVFPNASLVNLTAISLERAHTTICSFKQCLIKKQVYGVIIISFGLLNWPEQQEVDVSRSQSLSTILCFFSSFFILFFLTIVSYISVFIKVRSNRHMHSNSAAGARKKKLTITLFTVIIGSLTAYFPLTIQLGVFMFHPQFANDIIWRLSLRIGRTAVTVVLFVVTSLINPIIYAMQVPEQGEMSWKSTSAELQTVQSRAIYHYVSSVSITIL